MKHTTQTVHDLLQSRWESDMPDKVMAVLRQHEGKPITTRLLDKMPGGKDTWRMERHYGWTSLETWSYTHSRGHAGITIMLARSEASVPIDSAWIEKENPAYYSARRERNHARMEAMNTRAELEAMAQALNEVETAREALVAAASKLEELAKYGTRFDPDKYELLRACGLRDNAGKYFINQEYKEAAPAQQQAA